MVKLAPSKRSSGVRFPAIVFRISKKNVITILHIYMRYVELKNIKLFIIVNSVMNNISLYSLDSQIWKPFLEPITKKKLYLNLKNGKIISETSYNKNKDIIITNEQFFEACKNNNIELVKLSLSIGIDKNWQNKDGITPLMIACLEGNLEIVKAILN